MLRKLILSMLIIMPALCSEAKGTDEQNAKEARVLFNKIYDMVFGDKGSSLTYSVNIIGLYKTSGDIKYKGPKQQYTESRYLSWDDGVTAYMVDKKKKNVDIYRHDDENKDEYLAKFKYNVNDFNFSYKTEGDFYIVRAKVKKHGMFGIREVEAKVNKANLHPMSMAIKLAIFKTTVNISNFKAGSIADANFVFPKDKFKDYAFVDHRKDKKK